MQMQPASPPDSQTRSDATRDGRKDRSLRLLIDCLVSQKSECKEVDKPDPKGAIVMKGSCACGGIQYELNDKFLIANHCHCSICRKVHGTAFGTFGHAQAEACRWIEGEEFLTGYQAVQGPRNFCRVCGSNMPSVFPEMNYVRIPLATLDDDPEIQPKVHLYVKSKVPWFEIADTLPQYPEIIDLRELVQQ